MNFKDKVRKFFLQPPAQTTEEQNQAFQNWAASTQELKQGAVKSVKKVTDRLDWQETGYADRRIGQRPYLGADRRHE